MSAEADFEQKLQEKLKARAEQGLLRSLVSVDHRIDFSSNDYLGFSRFGALGQNSSKTLPSGATGARLITGNSALAEETEQIIAQFHRGESALIFNTGYMANVGLLSSLAEKDDLLILDEYCHASLIDGARLSKASRLRFRHNDLEDLEKKLQERGKTKFVVTESIFSMDGDGAPLQEMVVLCEKFGALLIVDEAHASGVFGNRGEGIVSHLGLEERVYARVMTFGKALGLHGAAVLGSSTLQSYLINYARSFIYTTALPPSLYIHLQQAYQLLPGANRSSLFSLIAYFRTLIKNKKNLSFLDSHSPIQGIIVGDNTVAKSMATQLQQEGIFVKAILSPTVPKGTERLRICIHSFNSRNEIDDLFYSINQYAK